MSVLREGYPAVAATAALAVGVIAAAVWRRSWMLWLAGFLLLVLAVSVAWTYRAPAASSPEPVRAHTFRRIASDAGGWA